MHQKYKLISGDIAIKSKSIVFFIALASFFFSHCTNVGSYYGPRVQSLDESMMKSNINRIELDLIEIKSDIDDNKKSIKSGIKRHEFEISNLGYEIESNRNCICALYKEVKKEVPINIDPLTCFGCNWGLLSKI